MTRATPWRAAVPARRRVAACLAASLAVVTFTVPAAGLPPVPHGAAPARPVLEVYFLVDATADMGSAGPAVKAAVDGISRRLAARTSLRHGYGVFRDSNVTYPSPWHVYRRLSPVRADGGLLPVVSYDGGGDLPEGHVYGLDGALGEVHQPWTVFPEPAGFVGSRKVIVLVTSAEPKQGLGYPEMDEVVARLREAGVAVATLWVESESPLRRSDELRQLATRTGAVARGAVDCDGDRRPDLRRGDPLVCSVWEDRRPAVNGFADALVARFAT